MLQLRIKKSLSQRENEKRAFMINFNPLARILGDAFSRAAAPSLKISLLMLKVFIPLSIVTLALKELGILASIAPWFFPFMKYLGLPGEAAVTLLVGFTNNIYAALATMAALDLSARQITILGVVLGIAHSLFVETGILANLEIATLRIALFRIVAGTLSGIVMNVFLPGTRSPEPYCLRLHEARPSRGEGRSCRSASPPCRSF